MLKQLTTANEVIDALGGTSKVAALTESAATRVSNWRVRNKLPPETFIVMTDKLGRDGMSAPPELWGIKTVQPEARP